MWVFFYFFSCFIRKFAYLKRDGKMKQNDEKDKKPDEPKKKLGLLYIFLFVIIYVISMIVFSGCGVASCDAYYHKHNVSNGNYVIDTSGISKTRFYED